mmetsp:Transcript_70979/g.169346  ORF Transcript_70979/g.169346 Transcript_70979/m.169346 type:complete len:332 (+) Transcript_70979:782-1777(+)
MRCTLCMSLAAPGRERSEAHGDQQEVANAEATSDHSWCLRLRLQRGHHAGQVVVEPKEEDRVAKDRHKATGLPQGHALHHRGPAFLLHPSVGLPGCHQQQDEDGRKAAHHDDERKLLGLLQVGKGQGHSDQKADDHADVIGKHLVKLEAAECGDVLHGVAPGRRHCDHQRGSRAVGVAHNHHVDQVRRGARKLGGEHQLAHGAKLHALPDLELSACVLLPHLFLEIFQRALSERGRVADAFLNFLLDILPLVPQTLAALRLILQGILLGLLIIQGVGDGQGLQHEGCCDVGHSHGGEDGQRAQDDSALLEAKGHRQKRQPGQGVEQEDHCR